MLKSLLQILSGYRTVAAPAASAVGALNCLYESRFSHWRMHNRTDGGISFCIREQDVAAFYQMCESKGIQLEVGPSRGFPALFRKYKKRWGIPLGAAIFAVLTVVSCRVVWEVEVTGNEKLEDKEIIRMLADYGFGVGTHFRGMDFDVLQNEFLLTTDEIAWISVNMVGTVAHVQVRENLGGKHPDNTSNGIANVIATEDGQIVEVQIRAGKAAVVINDVVRAGDLLISGVIAVGEDGLRYEHADGQVFARVSRKITVEIPKNQEKKVYTGEENVRKTLIFFGKEIKLFGKSSIDNPTYDTILSEKNFSLPGGICLPILIREERDCVYTTESRTLSEPEAYIEAMKQYRTEMDILLSDSEILSIETEHYTDEQVYRITSYIVCITDIASTVNIATS